MYIKTRLNFSTEIHISEFLGWVAVIKPREPESGVTRTFAGRCGALLIPKVIGLRGTPGFSVLGILCIVGTLGTSSSRYRSFFPLGVALRFFLVSFLNNSASFKACPVCCFLWVFLLPSKPLFFFPYIQRCPLSRLHRPCLITWWWCPHFLLVPLMPQCIS